MPPQSNYGIADGKVANAGPSGSLQFSEMEPVKESTVSPSQHVKPVESAAPMFRLKLQKRKELREGRQLGIANPPPALHVGYTEPTISTEEEFTGEDDNSRPWLAGFAMGAIIGCIIIYFLPEDYVCCGTGRHRPCGRPSRSSSASFDSSESSDTTNSSDY